MIVNSRSSKKMAGTWRRHRCLACHAIFTSEETYQLDTCLSFQPKEHPVEPFCKDKIFVSIYQATDHLSDAITIAGHLTDTVMGQLLKTKPRDPVISSNEVKTACSRVLRCYNAPVALRYAILAKMPISSANDVKRFLKE